MLTLLPRFIRSRDAAGYLGMARDIFERDVRPELQEIPIGARGIAFDRLEMDAWADAYIASHARAGRSKPGGKLASDPMQLGSAKRSGLQASGSAQASPSAPLNATRRTQRTPSIPGANVKSVSGKLSEYEKAMAACLAITGRSP